MNNEFSKKRTRKYFSYSN